MREHIDISTGDRCWCKSMVDFDVPEYITLPSTVPLKRDGVVVGTAEVEEGGVFHGLITDEETKAIMLEHTLSISDIRNPQFFEPEELETVKVEIDGYIQ